MLAPVKDFQLYKRMVLLIFKRVLSDNNYCGVLYSTVLILALDFHVVCKRLAFFSKKNWLAGWVTVGGEDLV